MISGIKIFLEHGRWNLHKFWKLLMYDSMSGESLTARVSPFLKLSINIARRFGSGRCRRLVALYLKLE